MAESYRRRTISIRQSAISDVAQGEIKRRGPHITEVVPVSGTVWRLG